MKTSDAPFCLPFGQTKACLSISWKKTFYIFKSLYDPWIDWVRKFGFAVHFFKWSLVKKRSLLISCTCFYVISLIHSCRVMRLQLPFCFLLICCFFFRLFVQLAVFRKHPFEMWEFNIFLAKNKAALAIWETWQKLNAGQDIKSPADFVKIYAFFRKAQETLGVSNVIPNISL